MIGIRSIVGMALCTVLAPVAVAAPIIQNAGFESATTPAVSNNNFVYTQTFGTINGSTGIPGWTFGASGNNSFDGITRGLAISDNGIAPPEGVQAAFIQGTGTFSQTVSGFDNATYQLSLQGIGRNGGLGPDPISVTVGAQALTFSGAGTFSPSTTAWQTITSDPFTLTAGSYLVTFTGTIPFTTSDKLTSIDNIQFIPEPAGFVAVALGAVGYLAMRRRRVVA